MFYVDTVHNSRSMAHLQCVHKKDSPIHFQKRRVASLLVFLCASQGEALEGLERKINGG